MKISKKTQYGLRALVFLAKNDFSSIRKISEKENIPYYFLEKIFTDLEKSGLVASKKGSQGGYSLKNKDIKLIDVLNALGEKISLVDCLQKNNKCFKEKECETRKIWLNLHKKQKEYFNSINLKDLI